MLTVACYSEGTEYEREAEILKASLDRVGMAHHVEGFPTRGDWYANTAEKARFIRRIRDEVKGPLLYVDVDAFVHENCDAYFKDLADRGYDFGAHWYRGPAKGGDRTQKREEGWRMLSGTLFLGDTPGCRQLLSDWTALNDLWRSRGMMQGGGQKNLWFTTTCRKDLRIARLPGGYCYVFDRSFFYEPGEPIVIEHTIASRDHRGREQRTRGRARRVTELRQLLATPLRQLHVPQPLRNERVMADPMRQYWIDRYQRQGKYYVARAGRRDSYAEQHQALAPVLRDLVTGKRVLDFGCGPQRFRDVLEEQGREYVGVDLIPGLGTEELEDELPRGFDCAVAILVLQHIVDPAVYAHWGRQLFESLNPGGRLVVVDHDVQPGMAAHMAPRGIRGLTQLAPWHRAEVCGEYDGHWIGMLERAPAPTDQPEQPEQPEQPARRPRRQRKQPERKKP
jgi:SAM-dependent methyltransferase